MHTPDEIMIAIQLKGVRIKKKRLQEYINIQEWFLPPKGWNLSNPSLSVKEKTQPQHA